MADKRSHPKSKRPDRQQVSSSKTPSDTPEDDDSIIGKMFWRSLGVILLLALVGIAIFWITRDKPTDKEDKVTVVEPPKQRPVSREVPSLLFQDITNEAGIDFVHFNGAEGERLLPETMGGGGGFFDYDNDGDQDILLVNGTRWPWSAAKEADRTTDPKSSLTLYQNNGKGIFVDVTQSAGLIDTFFGMGPAFGDFNNDGWTDIFVTAVGYNKLYRNDQGIFKEVASEAGVAGDVAQWSCPAMWFDYDRDGKLDLIVGNYVTWTRSVDLSIASTLVGLERAYGQPTMFSGDHLQLFHNEGQGRFKEVSEQAGLRIANAATKVPVAKSLGIVMLDVNHDGWLDVCVANDTVANFLFVNNKDGTFKEKGASIGIALSRQGDATGAMGIDCCQLKNDDTCAIGIGNFANEPSSLYISEGRKPLFTDIAPTTGFGTQTKIRLTFGLFFADLDLDGFQDIVCANGHLEPEVQKVQPSQRFEQPPQIFWNSNGVLMLADESKTGADFQKPMVGRGATYADIDADGDVDILLMANNGKPRLLRNERQNDHHWIRVQLQDKNKTGAIGAMIEVPIEDNKVVRRMVAATRSYLSQCELTQTLGFGKQTPKTLKVIWPDQTEQTVAIEKLQDTLRITQSSGLE